MERGGNYDTQYQNQGMSIGNQQYDAKSKRTSDILAVVSLIIGIISIVGTCCLGGFLGVVGAILGIIAIVDQYCNKRAMAIIGTVLSVFGFIFTIVLLIFGSVSDSSPESAEKYDDTVEIIEETNSIVESDNVSEIDNIKETTAERTPVTKYMDLSLILLWWLRKNKELTVYEKVDKLYEIIQDQHITVDALYEDIKNRELRINTKGCFPNKV